MPTHCLNCQQKLSEKRMGAKFCSQECKNKYGYRLRSGQLSGFKMDTKTEPKAEKQNLLESTLRGVLETDPLAATKNPNPTKSIDAEFFNDLLNQDIFNVANKLEKTNTGQHENSSDQNKGSEKLKIEPVRNLLPEQYISKQVQKPSLLYEYKKTSLNQYLESKTRLEQEYKRLEIELKHQEDRQGNGIVFAAGLGAGVFGLLDTVKYDLPAIDSKNSNVTGTILKDKNGKIIPLDSKKGKTKKSNIRHKSEEPSIWNNIITVVLYTTIGTGAGYLAKNLTEEWREKDKQQRIAIIKNRMSELNKQYPGLVNAIQTAQTDLSQTQQYYLETIQVINPEYEKALKGASLEGLKINLDLGQNKNLKKGFKQTEPITFKSDKIIKATDLGKQEFKALNFDGLWREFFGLPSINFHALIHGNSGEGKSTFCLWFARYLAENFGRVLYVSGEEGVNKTFHDKLKFCQAEVDNFYILDVRTGEEFMQEIGENEFHFIILDSLHDMDIDARKLKEIFERYKNSGFICIDQNNKKGELLGANEKKHIVDLVVNVKNYTAETTKNRFKEKGMAFKTADFTEKPKKMPLGFKKKDDNNGYDLGSDRRGLV